MMDVLLDALHFAAARHTGYYRKGPMPDGTRIPYINHPIAVARQLAVVAGVTDVHVLCAAVLHDTVEDTSTTPEEIEARFGERIAGLVAEVTDDKGLTSADRKLTQEREARMKSPRGKLLRIADKTCNVRDITDTPPVGWDDERRLGYFDWAERVVGGMRGANAALEADFDAALARGRSHVVR